MAKIDLASIHRDKAALMQAVEQAGSGTRFIGNHCRCPWHDDKSPSAGIYESEGGVWRFRCHGPCQLNLDLIGVRAKIAGHDDATELRQMSGSQDEAPKPVRVFPTIAAILASIASYHNVEDHYPYTNPDTGIVDMLVIRCVGNDGKKSFLQGRSEGGGFALKAPAKPWPIFNRTALRTTDRVVVCEGEKCVKAFRAAGFIATTSPGGAGNADKADWSPLAGKTCVLWRDFDANGKTYIEEVANQLQKLNPPAKVFTIDVEELELPEKSDVVDFLREYGFTTKEEQHKAIESILSLAQGCGPSAKVLRLIEDTIAGKRYAVGWPWPKFDEFTNALLPGTVTMIGGDPGASKSFMLLQAARLWWRSNIPFALYQLESDEDGSHLMRALVQQTGHGGFLDWKWVKEEPDEARRIFHENVDFMDGFGARLWIPPSDPPSLANLTDWVNDRAKEGCRVIAIDPVTAADTSRQRWEDDRHFVLKCQTICRQHGASLVLVTHPTKGNGKGPAEMGGGAAYSRFTQTVLWLNSHEPAKEIDVLDTFGGLQKVSVNRTMKIRKARLGRGTGMEIGYHFGNGMLFTESGMVVQE